MPRGSKPGERRGGRRRGTPNKKTSLKDAVLCAAAGPNVSPLNFMLSLMRDPKVPTDLRIEMATAAAPFVYATPKATFLKRVGRLNVCSRDTVDITFRKMERKLTTNVSVGGGTADLSPLVFLLGVMIDPDATTRQRIKAARVAARYEHSLAHPDEMLVIEDPFGFSVDPAMARAIRDDRRRLEHLWALGAARPDGSNNEMDKLRVRIHERRETLKCPPGYTMSHVVKDESKLREFSRKGMSLEKLTPQEDAEEAHLVARVASCTGLDARSLPLDDADDPLASSIQAWRQKSGRE
jgi:hypothetical protein